MLGFIIVVSDIFKVVGSNPTPATEVGSGDTFFS